MTNTLKTWILAYYHRWWGGQEPKVPKGRYYFPFLKLHREGLVGTKLTREVLGRIHEEPPEFLVDLDGIRTVYQLEERGYFVTPEQDRLWLSVDADVYNERYHYRCDSSEEAVMMRLRL